MASSLQRQSQSRACGSLTLLTRVTGLGTKLKKEWTKNDREARKGATKSKPAAKPPVAKAETKATAGTKRKATDNDNAPAVKKTKTTTPKATAPATKTATPKAKAPPKTPAKATAKTTTKATTKPQQNHRGGSSQGPSRNAAANASASEPARPPRTKQTARRGGAFAGRGRIPVPPSGDFDAPPPYSEFPHQAYYSDGHSPSNSYRSYDSDPDDGDSLEPLGLLNGDYEIIWSDAAERWDHYDPDNFELCLTLEGNKLWGQFNLGVYEGVLRLNQRPMRSSHDRLEFTWRGREDMGPVIYGNSNKGGWNSLATVALLAVLTEGRLFHSEPKDSNIKGHEAGLMLT
ncbi:hypothetical protein FCULG_00007111 [Fusarium culmorum]|uniref:Uncharacterized protein n=1 Tax=Fusarium culmorum TaxID=5516 RepID=A0A2T4GW22_FUSCU|nr:hypothetical protein FCULG_00007111 [Fusarium culmorum]